MEATRSSRRPHPADLLAAGAVLVSGVLLLHWLSKLTFWRDEWEVLLHRRSWSIGTFFDPFVEHLIALPILIYKVLVAVFGTDSPAPYQLVGVCLFLLSVVLLFIYVRRRVGKWVALAAILPILFLGPSWDDLLFPFQMALFGSIVCGLGALLALDRQDRAGDVAATILLTISLLFSALGIPFVAGATVDLALRRDRFSRAFVIAVPTALYALWYLIWGHEAETFISFRNAANLPSYVLDGLASSLATYVGLGVPTGEFHDSSLDWGRPLLVLALALAGWRVYRRGRVPGRLWAAAAILLCFWSLTALNFNPFSAPTVGRYQYVGIVLIALVAAELLRGVRIGRLAVAAIVVVAAAAALANASRLRDAAHGLEGIAQQQRGGLAALELARDDVDPELELTEENSDVDYLGLLDAGAYLSAADEDGSPAYSPRELETAPEAARIAADKVFGAALALRLEPGPPGGANRCAAPPTSAEAGSLPVPPQGLVLRAERPGAELSLRRYASESYPVALGHLPPGTPAVLRIPSDRSTRPWTLQLSGAPVFVCAVRPG